MWRLLSSGPITRAEVELVEFESDGIRRTLLSTKKNQRLCCRPSERLLRTRLE